MKTQRIVVNLPCAGQTQIYSYNQAQLLKALNLSNNF